MLFTGAFSSKTGGRPRGPGESAPAPQRGIHRSLPSSFRSALDVRRSTFEGAARLPPARLALPNFQRTHLSILYCTTTATLRRAPQRGRSCQLRPVPPTAGMSLTPKSGQNEPRIEPNRSQPRRIRSAARQIGSNRATEFHRIPTGGQRDGETDGRRRAEKSGGVEKWEGSRPEQAERRSGSGGTPPSHQADDLSSCSSPPPPHIANQRIPCGPRRGGGRRRGGRRRGQGGRRRGHAGLRKIGDAHVIVFIRVLFRSPPSALRPVDLCEQLSRSHGRQTVGESEMALKSPTLWRAWLR
jgi:hypothetical protein